MTVHYDEPGITYDQPSVSYDTLSLGWAVPDISVEVAWTGQLQGVFVIGESLLGGDDVLAGGFGQNLFDDITADVDSYEYERGRSSDMRTMQQGTCTITVRDPFGKYNPEGGYYKQVELDDPVIYWRLGDFGTIAVDISGNQFNGELYGGVREREPGAVNDGDAAMSFNGVDSKIEFPNCSSKIVGGSITLECWAKLPAATPAGEHGAICGFRNGDSSDCDFYILQLADTNDLECRMRTGPSSYNQVTNVTVTPEVWHHLAFIYDDVAHTISLYVDAVMEASVSFTGPITDGSVPFAVGAQLLGVWGNWFAGSVDEVALYNKVLPQERIAAHYQAQSCLGALLTAMRPARIRRSYGGTTYAGFYGFTSRITYNADQQQATIECVDFWEWLAQQQPKVTREYGQTVSTIIGAILDACDSTDAAFRNLTAGGDIIPSFIAGDGTASAQSLIEGVIQTDLGYVTIDGAGRTTYLPRAMRFSSQSPVHTFMTTYAGGQTSIDKQTIFNQLLATRQINQQTVTVSGTPTGGTFTLTLDGETTSALNYDAAPADVKAALAALTQVGADNVDCAANIWDLSTTGVPTGGTFTLTVSTPYGTQTTSALPYYATASDVQTALGLLTNINPLDPQTGAATTTANVTCSGGPLPTAIRISFQGIFGGDSTLVVTHSDSFTGGSTPACVLTQSVGLPNDPVVCNFAGDRLPMTFANSLTGGTSPTVAISSGTQSGEAKLVTNTVSRDAYGLRPDSGITSFNFVNDGAAQALAAFDTSVFGDPFRQAPDLYLVNADETTLVQQLSRELGDVVAVAITGSEFGGGTKLKGSIQHIKESVKVPGRLVESWFTILDRQAYAFTIDESVIGGDDVLG